MSTGNAMALEGRQVKHHPAWVCLVASWNLHTKVGYKGNVKHSIDKMAMCFWWCYISVQFYLFTFEWYLHLGVIAFSYSLCHVV